MKVLVGLSGGVDSAIAAWLLKEQGYDVTCCFMRNWDSYANNDIKGNPEIFNSTCPQEDDYQDAKAVAEKLGLPLLRVDFIQEYWDRVFKVFLSEYEKGRTPNPDILCNKYIKFDAFYDYAKKNGFEKIATGHYASNKEENGFTWLTRAADQNKDQTYFLAQIPEGALADTIFPLGNLEKPEVRKLADQLALDSVSHKKDSTGICFIGERNFREFLSNYLPAKTGKIVDIDTGTEIGEHEGVLYYTLGQRKGMNITGFKGPWFVVGKDVRDNILYVTNTNHKDWLYSDSASVSGINWIVPDLKEIPEELTIKFRYRQPDIPIRIRLTGEDSADVFYPQLSSGVTPGQEAVFYDGEKCLGGGVIDRISRDGENWMERILETGKKNHIVWLIEEKKRLEEKRVRDEKKAAEKRRKSKNKPIPGQDSAGTDGDQN